MEQFSNLEPKDIQMVFVTHPDTFYINPIHIKEAKEELGVSLETIIDKSIDKWGRRNHHCSFCPTYQIDLIYDPKESIIVRAVELLKRVTEEVPVKVNGREVTLTIKGYSYVITLAK